MTEKRPWTEHEDRMLKKIVQDNKLAKWTQIARILTEQYAIKGRNGKQCKERYVKHINTLYPQQQWSYQDQMRLIQLHNEVGNKWAVIGNRLGGRSDNSVKNNFYSQLRKALKKINTAIQNYYRTQLKQFKSSILYHIIEVADEKLRGTQLPSDLDFATFSNELKNQLFLISLEEEDQRSQLEGQEMEKDREICKQLIDKLAQFGVRYKKRGKRNKNITKGFNLLTPKRYVSRKAISQNEQSQSSNIPSSSASNLDQASQDDFSRSSHSRSSRKNSCNSLNGQERSQSFEEATTTRTRTRSQGNIFKRFLEQQNFQINQNKDEAKEIIKMQNEEQVNNLLEGMWQQQNDLPLLMIKKSSSRLSNEALIMRPQFRFFEDSQIQMRILPEVQLKLSQSQLQQRLFHQ